MIPNQWYAILESSEVPAGRLVGVTRMGERLVLWRNGQGELACLRDLCAHRGAALSAGKIVGDHVECPFHGLQYDTSGVCRLIPANGLSAPVPDRYLVHGYPTRESHGFVWIWWGEAQPELPPLPFFDDIDDSYVYSTYRDHWAAHYSRAIENQLDVVHLPFVHKTTIGRGNRTVVDGPRIVANEKGIDVWVHNRKDDGTPPLKPDDMPEPARRSLLQFRFPNVWQNRISDNMRVMIAFAPIDDENTILYLRFYHRLVKLPLVDSLVAKLGMLGSIVVAHQDRRVVVTQRPKRSDMNIGEKLIQGDRPIVAYRTQRRKLIEAASQR